MKNHPKIIGKKTVFIDRTVKFGRNVTIYPNNTIVGNTVIGDNVVIYPFNFIKDSVIKDDCEIMRSHIEESIVENNVSVGPFARLRPKSHILSEAKIGNFVEVKNSVVGKRTKAGHLAYIGDADIEADCNIGCGVIFCNYNGKEKNRSMVGAGSFIGSNSNIIAPVNIGKNTYICAGTTLTKDTTDCDFVIGRARETIKPGYAKKYIKVENNRG